MTVMEEPENIKKFEYLLFVEFLELICRIAIIGIKVRDLIEYKVYLLLEIVYN